MYTIEQCRVSLRRGFAAVYARFRYAREARGAVVKELAASHSWVAVT
jgi:hypothetical protein